MNTNELGYECPFPKDFQPIQERLDPYQHVGRVFRQDLDDEQRAIHLLLSRGYKLIAP